MNRRDDFVMGVIQSASQMERITDDLRGEGCFCLTIEVSEYRGREAGKDEGDCEAVRRALTPSLPPSAASAACSPLLTRNARRYSGGARAMGDKKAAASPRPLRSGNYVGKQSERESKRASKSHLGSVSLPLSALSLPSPPHPLRANAAPHCNFPLA